MRIRFLPHIAFQVRDYERAVAFYQEVLGMRVLQRDRGETHLVCGDVHFYVEDRETALTFLAFETDDLDAAREELTAAGCQVGELDGEGYMVQDPFGLRFYLSATPTSDQ